MANSPFTKSDFILVPVENEPGEFYTVFKDGSYCRGWVPKRAKIEDYN